MESKIKWNEGEGHIIATYEGSGNGSASICSDINDGIDREQHITVSTVKGDNPKTESILVKQEGLREPFDVDDENFVTVDNEIYGVIKGAKYYELEYIEGLGKAYINTEYFPNSETRITIDCEILDSSSAVYVCGVNNWRKGTFYGIRVTTSGTTYIVDYGKDSGNDTKIKANLRVFFDINKNIATANNSTLTMDYTVFECITALKLLAGVTTSGTHNASVGKIYSCKIYDDGIQVRDYIPVIWNSGEVGLYDKINDTFYPSASNEPFVAGPKI